MSLLKKFITREDPFHIHKLLGVSCILNFIYRFYNIINYNLGFQDDYWTLTWIIMHMALSGTSLVFRIPTNRISKRPMIYPEFRAHSILFAYRSLFVMLLMWLIQSNTWLKVTRALTVLGTLVIADLISMHYILTSTETTMRGMPFNENVSKNMRNFMNFFYSLSQVLATLNTLQSNSYEKVFMIVFPIQIAAFLMTCVRKGILHAHGWHFLYTMSLLSNFVFAAFLHEPTDCSILKYWITVSIICILRFRFRFNKYLVWIGVIACF